MPDRYLCCARNRCILEDDTSLAWIMMATGVSAQRAELQWSELINPVGLRVEGVWAKDSSCESMIGVTRDEVVKLRTTPMLSSLHFTADVLLPYCPSINSRPLFRAVLQADFELQEQRRNSLVCLQKADAFSCT